MLLLYFTKVPRRAIFWEVFIRTTVTSSWSFLVLAVPLLLVQFEQYKVSLLSPNMLISALLIALFLILPNVVGVCIGLFMPLFFMAKSLVKLVLFATVVTAFALLPYLDFFSTGWSSLYSEIWIVQTLKKFAFLEHPLLPTYWLTSTLNGFFNYTFKDDSTFILITTSLVALVWLYVIFKASFRNMLMLSMRYIPDKNIIIEGIIRLFRQFVGIFASNKKFLSLKDIAIFLRDGRFWGQLLLFIGIFALYFMNLSESDLKEGSRWAWGQRVRWNELILHLNIIASAFMSSALAGRSLFPQFSIEYSKFWINQFSSHSLKEIIHYKLNTIGIFIVLICISVITASSIILQVSIADLGYAILHCVIFSYTISNMALKLGVLFHNKRSDNPVIVFSGPGGVIYIMFGIFYITFNAVLMLKIGLFKNEKTTWVTIFILENILINRILNNISNRVYKTIEYT